MREHWKNRGISTFLSDYGILENTSMTTKCGQSVGKTGKSGSKTTPKLPREQPRYDRQKLGDTLRCGAPHD